MKKLLAILLLIPSLALAQAEGKFTIRVDQWGGLFSDEFYHPNPNTAIDMMDFEINSEGGRTFLEQRRGWVRPVSKLGIASINSMFICQIASDSERIIVSMSDGEFYQNGGDADVWRVLTTGGGNTSANSNMILFKDTVVATGLNKIHMFKGKAGSPGMQLISTKTGFQYHRLLLHQDRIYAYGINVDSTRNKLVWWPEFVLPLNAAASFNLMLPDTTNGAGWLYVNQDDGDFITNVLPFQSHLVVYKSRQIFKVMISPSTNAPNEVVRVSDNVGAYGYGAVTEYNGTQYFTGENGVYSFDGVSVAKISEGINYWFRDSLVASTGRSKVFPIAVVDNKLFVSLPKRRSFFDEASHVGDARTFVYDIEQQFWYKFDFNGPDSCPVNESHYMLRYEYSPASTYALFRATTGGITLGQKLIFVQDSSDAVEFDNICMYPSGWKNNNYNSASDSINPYFSGAFFASGDLMNRRQFERGILYGRCGTADTVTLDIYSDRQTDTVQSFKYVLGATPTLVNRRFSNLTSGALIRYRLRGTGGAPKINFLELVGYEKGMADETE